MPLTVTLYDIVRVQLWRIVYILLIEDKVRKREREIEKERKGELILIINLIHTYMSLFMNENLL